MSTTGWRKRNRTRLLPGGFVEITLTKGHVTVIDARDDWVLAYTWHAAFTGGLWYAQTTVGPRNGKRSIYLHRLLCPRAGDIDHKNGDSLDNRRENLRPATRQQNMRAQTRLRSGKTSRYRGVYWDASRQRWYVRFYVTREKILCRSFTDEDEAARWWRDLAKEHWGVFSPPTIH